jgi:hypothetical protein
VDLAFNTAITAGIRERQNGFGGVFAQQQLRAANVRFGSQATDLPWPRDVRFSSHSDQIAASQTPCAYDSCVPNRMAATFARPLD